MKKAQNAPRISVINLNIPQWKFKHSTHYSKLFVVFLVVIASKESCVNKLKAGGRNLYPTRVYM